MGFLRFFNLATLILMVSIFAKTSMADPRTTKVAVICNYTVAVSPSEFASNFVPAFYNLSDLIDEHGFGTTVVGQGPDAVYALAQCYKDLNSTDCQLCFSQVRSIIPTCYRIGGRVFYDGCFGRYANFSFFDQGIDSESVTNCSSSKNSSQPDSFGEMVRSVTGNVSLKAQRNKGFAVGSDSSASNISVYAFAQCWESLDESTCNSCLQAAASSIVSCSPSVEGRALYAGCYMRYSTELFWNPIPEDSSDNTLWIILGSVLGGFLLLTGIALWKAKGYLGRLCGKSLTDSYTSGLPPGFSQPQLNFRYQDLKRATNDFHLSNKLGQGSYGSVYKGIFSDGRDVAVKRLFLNTRQWADQFFNEVNLVSQVRHKNLVKLLGCSVDGPESLLVYEYHFNRSLDHFIFDENQAKVLDWQKRYDIIQGVAEGLSYLHEESEIRIIHRDIKASNILLDAKLKPKITDFGLARSFAEDQSHLSTGVAGTLGYMAPEYVVHGHLTEKADVYSFGVLILEVVTGKKCTNGIGANTGHYSLAKIWSHYKAKTIKSIIDKSFYDDILEDEILHVVHVGFMCTQATPSYRPTMSKVVQLLRSKRDQGDGSPMEPPFLDVLAPTEPGECSHTVSAVSGPSISGSSESLIRGR